MRLALDAMGGDDAPKAMVQGAIDFARIHPQHTVLLVGQSEKVTKALADEGGCPENIHIHEAPEVIGMADKMTALREKPNDSMNTCARLLKAGDAEAAVLCGNTACSVAAAQLHLGRIRGVKRAGILTPLPNVVESTWVIDCGANAVAKPEFLMQWAEMASIFVHSYKNIDKPRVGVLSIGSEDTKGDDLTATTLQLLRESDLNLVGNVEGNDIFNGSVDIVVCDGFTGNVVLKTAEGIASAMTTIIKEGARKTLRSKIGALLMKPAFQHVKDRTHWSKVGGCLLAGVDGNIIIGHGRSDRVAVEHALRQASRLVETRVTDQIRERYSAQTPARKASFFDSVRNFFGNDGAQGDKQAES